MSRGAAQEIISLTRTVTAAVWLSALLVPMFLVFEAHADQIPITDDIDGRWNLIVTETLKSGPRREHKCLPEKNQCSDYTYFKANDGSTGYLSEVRDTSNRVIERDVCFLLGAQICCTVVNLDRPQPIATVYVKEHDREQKEAIDELIRATAFFIDQQSKDAEDRERKRREKEQDGARGCERERHQSRGGK